MTVIAFSNYLLYNVGGAEPSLLHLLERRFPDDRKIAYSFEKPSIHNISPLRLELPDNVDTGFIPRIYGFSFFPFLEYCMNRKSVGMQFADIQHDKIVASSYYAATAIIHSQSKEKFIYIQSDIELGFLGNYERGIKFIFKFIYNLIQKPFIHILQKDIKKALRQSHVIANSHFTKSILKKHFGIQECEVIHPFIDEEKLQSDFKKSNHASLKKGIIFMGDAPHKGILLVEEISQTIQEDFYIFSKQVKQAYKKKNVQYMPWVKNPIEAYKYAKLVIMPSQCNETFGRVAREATILNIPILASRVGGIPEAVYFNDDALVDDFRSPTAWIHAIKSHLG